ncbi:MAG: TAXI family TRAP transporter solute-binding subunit [Rhodospirillales bacterium]|jgi:TRAP transporter TAXI family solute receptor|nr:TAXI family TRAP transporter solute-binding subunit [Rhodospirillales bacterium]
MQHIKLITGALALVSVTIGFDTTAYAQTYNTTLSGASPGGLWSRIGGGIDAAIAKAYPGSTVSYQTSSGGLANVPLVAAGKVPMGLATDGELNAAVKGSKPYKKAIGNTRILFRVYTPASRFQMDFFAVTKSFADKHSIKTVQDIVSKKLPIRIAINRRGNMDADVGEAAMNLMGISRAKVEGWGGQVIHAASKEIVSLVSDNRLDVVNFGISYNHPRVREIAKNSSPVLLSYGKDVASKVAEQFGGEVCYVKPGEYKWSPNGAASVCMGAVVVVNANMDAKLAYNLTRAMVEQIETFKNKSHRLIKKTASPKVLAQKGNAPHHPGALKYFKEKGLVY